jgi:hypothetical protein
VREVVAAGGQVIPAGGGKTNVATMTVIGAPDSATPSGEDAGETVSVWEGMSGAAVWASDLLVGLVVRHELREGAASLTVHRVPDPGDLGDAWVAAVPGLSWPVVLRAAADRVAETHRRVARQLAPRLLSGRAGEIGELETFVAGSFRWWWWSAEAFAGKTALTAWWVACRGDPETAVVACFLRRAAGQNTPEDVVRSWAPQLGALAGLNEAELWELSMLGADAAGITRLQQLIEDAARRCPRLVLVIDGLDEYAATAKVPVAEWLPDPQTLPAGMGLLVTSRKDAPVGIPADHPLHHHVHRLKPSPVAGRIRALAEAEIENALQDTIRLDHRILSFLAAADGPLTFAELASLINLVAVHDRSGWTTAPSEIDTVWRRHLARTLSRDPATGGLVFAHNELQTSAQRRFADDLPHRRSILHEWADEYAGRGWPADTPQYLLREYFRMLHDHGEARRLVALATDRARHALKLDTTGGDAAALAEIRAAQDFVLAHPEIDLTAMALLAVRRHALTARNRYIPEDLPALWATLGQPVRGGALAASITDPVRRAHALTTVVAAAAATRDLSRAADLVGQAELVIRSIVGYERPAALTELARTAAAIGDNERVAHLVGEAEASAVAQMHPISQVVALAGLAEMVAARGDRERASHLARRIESITHSVSDPEEHARASDALVLALLAGGDLDRSEKIARTITDRYYNGHALTAVAVAVASLDRHRAQQITRAISDAHLQAAAMADLAELAAAAGDREAAVDLIRQIEAIVSSPTTPSYQQNQVLVALVRALVAADDHDQAEQIARSIDPTRYDSKEALTIVARAVGAQGDLTRAQALAQRIEFFRATVLAELVQTAAKLGRHEDAARLAALAETAAQAHQHTKTLRALAEAFAAMGDQDRAEAFARSVAEPTDRADYLTAIARTAAATDSGRAARLAGEAAAISRMFAFPITQADELIKLGEAVTGVDRDRAAELVLHAERIATRIADEDSRDRTMPGLVRAWAGMGAYDRAEEIAQGISDGYWRRDAFDELVPAMAAAGRLRTIRRIAATDPDQDVRDKACAALAPVLLAKGHALRAVGTARAIRSRYRYGLTLAKLARAAVDRGDARRAAYLAGKAESTATTMESPSAQAEVITALVPVVAVMHDTARLMALVDRALALIHGLGDGDDLGKGIHLTSLVSDLAAVSHYDRAAAIVPLIADWGERWKALQSLARAMAPSDPEGAERVVRSITNLYAQVTALADIAQAVATADPERAADLVRRGEAIARGFGELRSLYLLRLAKAVPDPGTARRLVGEALLLTDEWTGSVDALGTVDPAALLAMADSQLELVSALG